MRVTYLESFIDRINTLYDNFDTYQEQSDNTKLFFDSVQTKAQLGAHCRNLTLSVSAFCSGSFEEEENVLTLSCLYETVESIYFLVTSIPKRAGKTLAKTLKKQTLNILNSVVMLVKAYLPSETGNLNNSDFKKRLAFSLFDESCNNLKKVVLCNRNVVQEILDSHVIIIKDVIKEIKGMLVEPGPENNFIALEQQQGLSELKTDAITARRCLAIIRLTKVLYKRVIEKTIKELKKTETHSTSNENLEQFDDISFLDDIAEYCTLINKQIDEIGCTLWRRHEDLEINSKVTKLSDLCISLIDLVVPFTENSVYIEWFDKCKRQYYTILESVLERIGMR